MADVPDSHRHKKTVRSFLLELAAALSGALVMWWWLGAEEWKSMLIALAAFLTVALTLFLWQRSGAS